MSILPSAILALKNGAGKPALKPLATPVAPRAGAGGPTDSTFLPPAVMAKKSAPPPAIPPIIKDPSDPKPKRRTKADRDAEARAAVSDRIRALIDSKPNKGKVLRYMADRVSELTLAAGP